MNEHPQWVHEDVPREALNALLDLLDRQPFSERTRPPVVRLDDKVPSFRRLDSVEDREYAWRLIEALEKDLGWITIGRPRKRHGGMADYECAIRLSLNAEAEDIVRSAMGRPPPRDSYAQLWQEAVLKVAREFPAGDPRPLSRSPIVIPGRSCEEVAQRLLELNALPDGTLVRAASARTFWGLSKLLDVRVGAVNAMLGREVLREKPVLLAIHAPSPPEGLLFVENEESYQAMCEGAFPESAGSLALIWSAGFRASAKRLVETGGTNLHYSSATPPSSQSRVGFMISNPGVAPVYFFGDLDFSGMQILKQLRSIFPNAEAWRPGYERLLEAMSAGMGHPADAADKRGQRDPGETGCAFADFRLLPALRLNQSMVDQEVCSA